jgi:hypothetical protein
LRINGFDVIDRGQYEFAERSDALLHFLCDKPEYDQITVTTGISIFGKMSVGVVAIEVTPKTRIRMAATINV